MSAPAISTKRADPALKRKHKALLKKQFPDHTVRRYGDGRSFNNCLRIKDSKRSKGSRSSRTPVRPYETAFIAHRGYRIDGGNTSCHSHQCGTPRSHDSICINGRHVLEQSQADNNKRQRHHHLIRRYEREFRRKYPTLRRTGPLFVADILEFVDPESEEYTECDCEGGRCFINYGLRGGERRRSGRVRNRK